MCAVDLQIRVPTILFQPRNRIGLGHVNRLAAIADELRRSCPGIRVPFVVDGSAGELLESYGLPYFSLPSPRESGAWKAWGRSEQRDLATNLCKALLARLQPRIVVFDCFPSQVFVKAVLELQIETVLVIREMRDWHGYIRYIEGLIPEVRLILLAHTANDVRLPAHLESRTVRVGTVVRHCDPTPDLSNDTSLVVVTGGGGGSADTWKFYNLALASLAEVRKHHPELHGLLVTGPQFTGWLRLQIPDGVRVTPFCPALEQVCAASGLVIARGGYNTVAELLESDVPTIILPCATMSDDQVARANHACRISQHVLSVSRPSKAELVRLVLSLMETKRKRRRSARRADGARTAASALLDLAFRGGP